MVTACVNLIRHQHIMIPPFRIYNCNLEKQFFFYKNNTEIVLVLICLNVVEMINFNLLIMKKKLNIILKTQHEISYKLNGS